MAELADAAAEVLMGCDSIADEDVEQREPGSAAAGATASAPVNGEHEKKIDGDAALPGDEDATSKVSNPSFVPCSRPFAQHLTPLDCHAVELCCLCAAGCTHCCRAQVEAARRRA